MENNNSHINFSAEDLRRYVAGELPPASMHAIEKAALEDPFLADALEGMQESISAKHVDENGRRIAEIRKKIQQEKSSRSIFYVGRTWMRVAAALIIIAGATLIYTLNRQSKSPVTIAKHETNTKVDSDAALHESVTTQPLATNADTVEQKIPATAFNNDAVAKTNVKKTKETEEPLNFVKAADSTSASIPQDSVAAKSSVAAASLPQIERAVAGRAAGLNISSSPNAHMNVYVGRIIDANNKPVADASIILRGTRNGTISNNDGYFSVRLADRDTLLPVTVNAIGYKAESTSLLANDTSKNTIRLQTSEVALNEVVVVGYANKSDDDVDEERPSRRKVVEMPHTEPEIGWPLYQEYLENNKSILTADSTLRGTETMEFDINRRGRFTSIHFTESISPAHDAEILRLVKKGPPFKKPSRGRARAKVSVAF